MSSGLPSSLGAHLTSTGGHFSIYSSVAERVQLCLFHSDTPHREERRVDLDKHANGIWHVFVPGVTAGQVYGYRVSGPYRPEHGLRCNPAKVLLDPYARVVARAPVYDQTLYDFHFPEGHQAQEIRKCIADIRDNQSVAPLAAVLPAGNDLSNEEKPRILWRDTLIYEAHVKGLTAQHPDVEPGLRGTYLGVASQPIIEHFQKIGVTAVELLPVHYSTSEPHLHQRKLSNYWGYNTLSFFAPDARFATDGQGLTAVKEFREMVRALHRAGIEVILDVVYNHTADGGDFGPTYSFRGFDNPNYYQLRAEDPSRYLDFTGCGNTLQASHPMVLRLVMDSLRYWAIEMGVDGFRFDLLSALLRRKGAVDLEAPLLLAILQDPILSQLKLIAEPWDAGDGGYCVSQLPPGWSEWNGKYRDSVRRFLKGNTGSLSEFTTRVTGSSDFYRHRGRSTWASINFITSHDGFTLRDLVSYNEKHNELNLDDNRDGENNNDSWNHGIEGPSTDLAINELRLRQQKNALAILFLSSGIPMLTSGDELSRTQHGNNNSYCLDTALNWLDWHETPERKIIEDFIARLGNIREQAGVFSSGAFFEGIPVSGTLDLAWYHPSGRLMEERDWYNSELLTIGALYQLKDTASRGKQAPFTRLLVVYNLHQSNVVFRMSSQIPAREWKMILHTDSVIEEQFLSRGLRTDDFEMTARSIAVFCS